MQNIITNLTDLEAVFTDNEVSTPVLVGNLSGDTKEFTNFSEAKDYLESSTDEIIDAEVAEEVEISDEE